MTRAADAERRVRGAVRVLIYEPYPFGKIAGNLRTLLYILRFTDRDRLHLTLAVPFETPLVERARGLGVDTVVVAPPDRVNRYGQRVLRDRWHGRLLTVPAMLAYNLRVRTLLRDHGIDVVYCNGIRALMTVAVAGLLTRTPLVWYVKGTLENPILDRLGFFLADRILFFCESNRDDKYPWLVHWFRRRVGIVKIGLDLEEIRSAEGAAAGAVARELSITADTLGVAYLGQLYAPKGVHHLVEAFARVASEFPAARLFLIGDPVLKEYGDYEPRLRELVARLGLAERVVFTGWREDALAIVHHMAVVVHPSLAEGFGRAVLESMALGRAVIASRVGGLRETIRDGENGFLVDPADEGAIEDRLRRLLSNGALRERLGARARETVLADHLVEDKIAQLNAEWERAARIPPEPR